VAIRLLVASFKGKALDWYRSLTPNTISTWDHLGDAFFARFKEKGDKSSLLQQLITIKRAPQEAMTDFNSRFQKTWERIPATARPLPGMAIVFYLKALNLDISVMIQSLGGQTLPEAYGYAVRAENNLIDAGKLPSRPPMPMFLEITLPLPQEAPNPIAPPVSMYTFPQ